MKVTAASDTSASPGNPAGVDVVAVPGSFHSFYTDNHQSIVRALSLTLGDTQLATEAADEAMCRALQRWDKVSTFENAQGWVYRVGLNWARSWLRRRRRERDRPIVFGPLVAQQVPVDPSLIAALRELSVEQRSVVVLRYYLDWSVGETAAALDIAPGTVKSRLARALDQLRALMGDPS